MIYQKRVNTNIQGICSSDVCSSDLGKEGREEVNRTSWPATYTTDHFSLKWFFDFSPFDYSKTASRRLRNETFTHTSIGTVCHRTAPCIWLVSNCSCANKREVCRGNRYRRPAFDP